MKNVLVLDPLPTIYGEPFYTLFDRVDFRSSLENSELNDYDLVVFTGGTDIDPKYYHEQMCHRQTDNPDGTRDATEARIFHAAKSRNIPMTGICRGAQFGCALSGGSVIQHVKGHSGVGGHTLTLASGDKLQVNSLHHQLMYPWITKHELIGWTEGLSDLYENGHHKAVTFDSVAKTGDGKIKEPDIVWFPNTRFLAVQYHPEMMDNQSDGWKYYQHLIKEYLV